jgi:hypothetical protein
MFADEERRLVAFTRVLGLAALCALAVSWKLWLSRPLYPMVPVGGLVPPFPWPWDAAVLGVLATALIGLALRPRANPLVWAALGVFAVLFAQDQNRMWPSFYQFACFLLIRSGLRDSSDAPRVVQGLRFVAAATYFWGGVHKLNPYFFREEFPWFVEPLTRWTPGVDPALPALGAAAAVLETLMGIGLLTTRWRRVALAEAMVMHALILVCIGPLRDHWNDSSWVWGQAAAVQTWILFYAAPPFQWSALVAGSGWRRVPTIAAVLLVGALPALNLCNRWDSALSFNVYTGNVHQAEIRLLPAGAKRLPPALQQFVTWRDDCAVLHLNQWTLSEFNANPYPENRIFLAVFRRVGEYVPPGTAALFVREKWGWLTPRRLFRYEYAPSGRLQREELPLEPVRMRAVSVQGGR